MGIEINRVRAVEGGRIRCEMEFDNLSHFSRCANEILAVPDGAAFAPVEPTAASYYAEAAARLHFAAEREAKREAAQKATGRDIPRSPVTVGDVREFFGLPRAHVPPFVQPENTVIGGNAYPPEEPEALTAGTAYEAHEMKVGGTD